MATQGYSPGQPGLPGYKYFRRVVKQNAKGICSIELLYLPLPLQGTRMSTIKPIIYKTMRIELDIEKNENGFDIYVSDENCGSGISVVGNTAEEVVENLTPYLHDYLYRMEHPEEYEEYDEDEEYATED